MKEDIFTQFRAELASYGCEKAEEATLLLERIVGVMEASQPANLTRNVPIKSQSDTETRLNTLIKTGKAFSKAIDSVYHDKELQQRLKFPPNFEHQMFIDHLKIINKNAIEIKKYQTAKSKDYKVGHFRPEFKGTNVQSANDLDIVGILIVVLERHFPEIKPRKNAGEQDKFLKLASILLEKNPQRTINKCLENRLINS